MKLPQQTPLPLIAFFSIVIPGSFSAQEAPGKKIKAPPAGTAVIRDIHFATHDGIELQLDLYRPDPLPVEPLPVVLWVHGGGWIKGSKDRCQADFLAQHGFAVASVGYRLTPVAQWPAQIEDCFAAVKWVREHHESFQLNPDSIGAWGGSAGGHLVALMGTRPGPGDEDIRVQAVCDWYGPTNLLTMPPNVVSEKRTYEQVSQSNGAKLLGAPVPDATEQAKDASAFFHVTPDDAPFLIMHGSEDPGVPLEQSTLFFEELQKSGVEAELVILEGAGHGGKEFAEEAVRDRIIAFFRRHLL